MSSLHVAMLEKGIYANLGKSSLTAMVSIFSELKG